MLRLLAACLVINVLLLGPQWLRFGELAPRWVALEALMLVALVALLPTHPGVHWLRWSLVLTVMLAVLMGLGDAATHLVLGRSLNLYLDWPLLRSVTHQLVGNLGAGLAVVAHLLAGVALLLVSGLLARGLASLQGLARGGLATAGLAGVVLVAGGVLLACDWNQARLVPVARTPLVDTLRFQGHQWVETRQAHRDFVAYLEAHPGEAQALPGLAGRDVVLVFVESYGVSAVYDAPYAEVIVPRLEAMEARLAAAGLEAVTGTLAAPVRGGQSWLAHATVLSGLWIDNPLWYRLLLDSERATLVDDFRATGQRTLTVMPAITLAWPEGEAYGFDAIHAASDLDYAGPSLHWVTMPDQYTLHHFETRIRPSARPVFAQIALISSHAPWTPILPVLEDTQAVGDGRIFARWADAGDTPEVLWQDRERVRAHYALAVDYSLQASQRWLEDAVDDETLLILLGDHQSAPLITGERASDGVPVHVISGDPSLLAPFRERGFVPGMVPPERRTHPGMDRLRHWLHEDFGS